MARIRITGGAWRSRLITVTEAPGLRPTPDRVRETLFNWLGQDLSGLHCLDLFAGSGILGLEAASRSAASVALVEKDRKVFATLQRNLVGLAEDAVGKLELHCGDALEFAAAAIRQNRQFDVILLDPPYRQDWPARMWPVLPPLLAPTGKVYIEAETALAPPAPWHTVKHGRAGQVTFHLMELE